MGPYSETIIATRADDGDIDMGDRGWFIYGQLVVLLYCFIGFFSTVAYIAYMAWDYIGLITGVAVIGLGFLACKHYGTSRSILGRLCYRRLSPDQRIRIKRRLSGKV